MLKSRRSLKKRATALVVVLSIIVFLSLLVVALSAAMRMDRQAAHYYSERARAEFLAREGVEYVKAALLAGTGATNRWVSMPGRIVSSVGLPSETPMDLFSGTETNAAAAPNALAAVDLNRSAVSDDSAEAILPAGPALRVGWIYVRQNGLCETNQNPSLTDTANPIVGRFAYWTDDESSRIDLNTAWKRQNNTNSPAHPDKVSLQQISDNLTEADADAIRGAVTNFPFLSPDDARRLSAPLGSILSTNRFAVGSYSHSPELNPWGEPKIILTTQASRARGSTNFLDIVLTDNTDPGKLAALSTNKVTAQLNKLTELLSRTNWPYASQSFAQKYGSTNALQLALDILEYVRAAESTEQVVQGMRLHPLGGGAYEYDNAGVVAEGSLVGATRRPMLTELGIWMSPPLTNAATGRLYFDISTKAEIYLPARYAQSPVNLEGKVFSINFTDQDGGTSRSYDFVISPANTVNCNLAPGNFAVATFQTNTLSSSIIVTNRPTALYMRSVLNAMAAGSGWASAVWDIAPAARNPATNNYIRYTLDAAGGSATNITSMQVNDPRINKNKANWVHGNATWGTLPKTSVTASPPQDTDAGGGISEASLFMPPAKSPAGTVGSAGELGYVSTSVPWRTVRLQPAPNGPAPADWALLDLFAAPILPSSDEMYLPRTNVVAGRVNLNAAIQPFTNLSRLQPLGALFRGVTNLTLTADQASSNIASLKFATGYQGTNYYRSAGELAEIQGIADRGEASESVIRDMASLATVQGNVFRVFSVGQTLKQTPGGKLVPQAEKSLVALIERYDEGGTSRYRTVYWKVLPF